MAAVAFARAASGRFSRRPWTPLDDSVSRWFVISLDVQVLLGIVIYMFFSPYTMSAWRNIGGVMGEAVGRFWVVEHLVGMLAAVSFAHVGRVRIRKADPTRRHFLAAVFFGLALVIMIISIPWPFSPAARPVLRGF